VAIVTLVSGGFDSTLMSVMAQEEGVVLHPLFVNYGQLGAEKEWAACQRLHERFRLPQVTRMDIPGFGRTIPSGITNAAMRINEDAFLPGRNLLFLLAGAAHAYRTNADGVAIGILNPEDHLFPDQTYEFLKHAEVTIEVAMGRRIFVLAPLIAFTKSDVLAMARARGIDGTYSCHSGNDVPCGRCVACVEILNAEKRS